MKYIFEQLRDQKKKLFCTSFAPKKCILVPQRYVLGPFIKGIALVIVSLIVSFPSPRDAQNL